MTRQEERQTYALAWLISGLSVGAMLLYGCSGPSMTTPSEPQYHCQNVQWQVLAFVPSCCTPDNPYGPSYSGVTIIGPKDKPASRPESLTFPYTVPAGKYLGISSASFQDKLYYWCNSGTDPLFPCGAHGSYFHLSGAILLPPSGVTDPDGVARAGADVRATWILTVTGALEQENYARYSPPLLVNPGQTIHADFANGAPHPQWMGATVTGYLSDSPTFEGCNFVAVDTPSVVE